MTTARMLVVALLSQDEKIKSHYSLITISCWNECCAQKLIERIKLEPMMIDIDSDHTVRHFREALFWPVQLMPLADGGKTHWELLAQGSEDNPWRRLKDRFHEGELDFEERHYKEFVAFLPYVQRFLYGESYSLVCLMMPMTRLAARRSRYSGAVVLMLCG